MICNHLPEDDTCSGTPSPRTLTNGGGGLIPRRPPFWEIPCVVEQLRLAYALPVGISALERGKGINLFKRGQR